jgi:DNA-binding transcriptional ArsR family regulator
MAKKSIEGTGTRGETPLASLLAAVGDELRLQILKFVAQEPASVSQICHELDAAQPRVSHHLGILRRCGLLAVETKGRQRVYRWAPASAGTAAFELQSFLRRWLELGQSPNLAPPRPAGTAGQELDDFLL